MAERHLQALKVATYALRLPQIFCFDCLGVSCSTVQDGLASAALQGFNFGVDPSLDPELALALRVSLEEERARQEAAQSVAGGAPAASEEPATEGFLWTPHRHTPFTPSLLYCKFTETLS